MFSKRTPKYSIVERLEEQQETIAEKRKNSDEASLSQTSSWKAWRSRYTTGFRFCIASAAALSIIVLVINIALASYSISHYGNGNNGIQTLFAGSCSRARITSTALHLLINVLSTLLLGASNYCMQCLSAPTRSEIDAAHRKSIWLDIGVPSTRNLTKISFKRSWLWWILGMSSLPLHLL
jgi:hypothetical protein